MHDYDDLAARAERSELAPLPGTQLHGEEAAEHARAALLAATGADTLDDAVIIARVRLSTLCYSTSQTTRTSSLSR